MDPHVPKANKPWEWYAIVNYAYCPNTRGGKVNPNPFAHPNLPTVIEPKLTQLLVGLNGHQPN